MKEPYDEMCRNVHHVKYCIWGKHWGKIQPQALMHIVAHNIFRYKQNNCRNAWEAKSAKIKASINQTTSVKASSNADQMVEILEFPLRTNTVNSSIF